MRLALLSALAEPHVGGGSGSGTNRHERPAFRRFAGKSVLAHQIDCAAHLACERIVCMAYGPGPDLGTAKAYAERAGLRFEMVDNLPRLASQITADDDVILIADGILPDRAVLVAELDQRYGVLAFPEEPALELGFERLDARRAWSGALRTRGDGVARLADLPADCDMASSLLRIALQSGVRVVELDAGLISEGAWKRRVDRTAVAEAERHWIARQVRPASFAAPGTALVQRIAMRLAQDTGGSRWARAPHAVALGGGLLAFAAAALGWPTLALLALLIGTIGLSIAEIFDRVEELGAVPRKRRPIMAIGGWIRDVLMTAALSALVVTVPGWLEVVLPIALVITLRLCVIARGRLETAFSDRITLLAILVAVAAAGWTTVAVAILLIVGLAALLWSTSRSHPQLTTN